MCTKQYKINIPTPVKLKYLTNHWREIVDPAGTTISQIKRYVNINIIK
jgi:hypothetical protein